MDWGLMFKIFSSGQEVPMGAFVSDYGGDLIVLPLKDFLRRGRGDDFVLQFERLTGRNDSCYGTLAINKNSRNDDDYARAVEALDEQNSSVMMVCVEDPESASPYLFVKVIEREGKKYSFPIIFNAALKGYAEDGVYVGSGEESFNLRLGDYIDPERKCAMRIMYAPGERIEWNEDELREIFSFL